jgi:hypothetical protein
MNLGYLLRKKIVDDIGSVLANNLPILVKKGGYLQKLVIHNI